MIKCSWTQVKQAAFNKSLSVQWIQDDNSYTVSVVDGPFILTSVIPITTPANPDQLDFETNYMNSGTSNANVRGNMVQVLGDDSLVLNPFGAMINPAPNTLTNCDIQLPQTMVLRGGVMFSQNSAIGDWFSISVVDKDNVLGFGGTPDAPTVLGTYVISWYLMPGIENRLEDVSISQQLPQGVYLRIAYTSVGAIAPIILVNLISYIGTP